MRNSTGRNLVIYVFCLVVFVGLSWLVYQAGGGFSKAFGPKGFLGIAYDDDSLIITRVIPNSPAEDAGLKVGDRIVSINGVRPVASSQVTELISKNRPGSKIEITVLRTDEKKMTLLKMTFLATLIKKPNE